MYGQGLRSIQIQKLVQFWFALANLIFKSILSFKNWRDGNKNQRWSPRGRPWPRGRPRGQILKSLALALASKVKSLALALASRPQVLENWPVLGSRTALFFGKLKFCGAVEKFFGKRFFVEIAWKIFVKTFFFFFEIAWKIFVKTFFFFFFFLESTCALCPWSLALASSIPVLGLESVCPRKGCPWPWPRIFFVSLALALASSLVSSTPPLIKMFLLKKGIVRGVYFYKPCYCSDTWHYGNFLNIFQPITDEDQK